MVNATNLYNANDLRRIIFRDDKSGGEDTQKRIIDQTINAKQGLAITPDGEQEVAVFAALKNKFKEWLNENLAVARFFAKFMHSSTKLHHEGNPAKEALKEVKNHDDLRAIAKEQPVSYWYLQRLAHTEPANWQGNKDKFQKLVNDYGDRTRTGDYSEITYPELERQALLLIKDLIQDNENKGYIAQFGFDLMKNLNAAIASGQKERAREICYEKDIGYDRLHMNLGQLVKSFIKHGQLGSAADNLNNLAKFMYYMKVANTEANLVHETNKYVNEN